MPLLRIHFRGYLEVVIHPKKARRLGLEDVERILDATLENEIAPLLAESKYVDFDVSRCESPVIGWRLYKIGANGKSTGEIIDEGS